MKPEKYPFPSSQALNVQSRFEQWRQSLLKKGPIPDELWQAAVELSRQFGVHKVSRLLRLDYSCLKKKTTNRSLPVSVPDKPKEVSFLELPAIIKDPCESCRIELKRPDGIAMQIHLSSTPDMDLCGLIKAFIQ